MKSFDKFSYFSKLQFVELHEIGQGVIIWGRLKTFNGTREIIIEQSRLFYDDNEETRHIIQCIQLYQNVYSQTYQIQDNDQNNNCMVNKELSSEKRFTHICKYSFKRNN